MKLKNLAGLIFRILGASLILTGLGDLSYRMLEPNKVAGVADAIGEMGLGIVIIFLARNWGDCFAGDWMMTRDKTPRKYYFMPYVNVRITKDGVTARQKAQVVLEITQTLQRVLGKLPEQTHIIIDEVEPENWGFSGMLTTEYRKRQKKKRS